MEEDSTYRNLYKHLENKVVDLSYQIKFVEKNFETYSIWIADLILQAASQMESIAKKLYKNETQEWYEASCKWKTNFYFDFDCIEKFIKDRQIDKRIIELKESDLQFSPFIKNTKRFNSTKLTFYWNSWYQYLKHDLLSSQEKANIRCLLDIMSALFLLNLYQSRFVIKMWIDKSVDNLNGLIWSNLFYVDAWEKDSAVYKIQETAEFRHMKNKRQKSYDNILNKHSYTKQINKSNTVYDLINKPYIPDSCYQYTKEYIWLQWFYGWLSYEYLCENKYNDVMEWVKEEKNRVNMECVAMADEEVPEYRFLLNTARYEAVIKRKD